MQFKPLTAGGHVSISVSKFLKVHSRLPYMHQPQDASLNIIHTYALVHLAKRQSLKFKFTIKITTENRCDHCDN